MPLEEAPDSALGALGTLRALGTLGALGALGQALVTSHAAATSVCPGKDSAMATYDPLRVGEAFVLFSDLFTGLTGLRERRWNKLV